MRPLFKPSRSVQLLGLLGLVLLTTAFARLGWQDFVLENRIGVTITELYISPVSTADWEEDVLGDDVLFDGESVEIQFDDQERATKWDLMAVTEDGEELVWDNLDLSVISEVTLYHKNGEAWARTQ